MFISSVKRLSALTLSLLLAVINLSGLTHAQNTDFQSWTQVTTTVNLDPAKQWFLYGEVQPRVGDDISRLERLLVRPALGYNFTPNVALYLGYAWTPTFTNASYDEDFRNENRIWQQLLIKHTWLGLDWQHRLRQEQRIIDDAGGTSNGTRYLVRGSYALPEYETIGLTGYNELFVTENGVEKGPVGGFDRDRFFFGPYLKSGPGRYEIGYLGEYARQFDNDSRMVNAILASANFAFWGGEARQRIRVVVAMLCGACMTDASRKAPQAASSDALKTRDQGLGALRLDP